MLTKVFKLQGKDVTVKELTIGQFLEAEVLRKEKGDMATTMKMVEFGTGKKIDKLPASALMELSEIGVWLIETATADVDTTV